MRADRKVRRAERRREREDLRSFLAYRAVTSAGPRAIRLPVPGTRNRYQYLSWSLLREFERLCPDEGVALPTRCCRRLLQQNLPVGDIGHLPTARELETASWARAWGKGGTVA